MIKTFFYPKQLEKKIGKKFRFLKPIVWTNLSILFVGFGVYLVITERVLLAVLIVFLWYLEGMI